MAEGSFVEIVDGRIDEMTAVWLKARPAPGRDCDLWRMDSIGNLIKYTEYGNPGSPYGWVIHRKCAGVFDGEDSFANKVPLHWRAHARLAA